MCIYIIFFYILFIFVHLLNPWREIEINFSGKQINNTFDMVLIDMIKDPKEMYANIPHPEKL